MTLFMHHLPCCLEPSISYLLLGKVLLSFSHGSLLLLLHLKHLLLVLQIDCASLHLESSQRVQVTCSLSANGRPDLEPGVTVVGAEAWDALHQILLLVVLLAHEGRCLRYAPESVVLVHGLLHSFIPLFV